MNRTRIWNGLLAVSLALNLTLVAAVVVLLASAGLSEKVAPRLHLASSRDFHGQAEEIDQLEQRTDDHEVQLQQLASSDVAGAIDNLDSALHDLDSRVQDLEDEVGNSFAIGDLSSRLDDAEAAIQDACSASRSAATSAIGSDLFYIFLNFQRAFC